MIFNGKLCSLTQALWRLSPSSSLPCKRYKLGPFRSEMQFDNFHSYSWAKAPVNTAGSEQGQPVFRRSDGPWLERGADPQDTGQLARSTARPDPVPAWGLMGVGGAPVMTPVTPESGILEHSSALAEPWETQLTSGPDPLEITGTVPVCMWVKPGSESTWHQPGAAGPGHILGAGYLSFCHSNPFQRLRVC